MNEITVGDLAKWFLTKEEMTHKKLQKACYYGVAWGWALMDRSVINDDAFEAWIHGPVSPILYNSYKHHGWNLIPKSSEKLEIPKDLQELLESVWLTYGEKSGNELEALSHSELPWIEARKGLRPDEPSKNLIDSQTMHKFYNSIRSTDF